MLTWTHIVHSISTRPIILNLDSTIEVTINYINIIVYTYSSWPRGGGGGEGTDFQRLMLLISTIKLP